MSQPKARPGEPGAYVLLRSRTGRPWFYLSPAGGGPMVNQTKDPDRATRFASVEDAERIATAYGMKVVSVVEARALVAAFEKEMMRDD